MTHVVTIGTPELGDRSYLVHDGSAAIVVDPQRDIDRILQAAGDAGVQVTHVAETHIHNDYVSGGLDLAQRTGAEYLVAAAEDVGFGRRPVSDGDEIAIGSFGVRVVATPGHTPHHVSYVVVDDGVPTAVLTGGSLLYGTVGRTDLTAPAATQELTRAQFRSVRRLAAELPDEAGVWPTHGFGSFCSSSRSSGADRSVLGHERRTNIALTIDDEDAFVERLLAGLTAHPVYYAHMAPINRRGPQPLDPSPPRRLDPAGLRRLLDQGGWVLDLAHRRAFAAGHIPGSVSFELGESLATYVGWVVPWGAPVTLVADTPAEIGEAQRALARIGFDRWAGAAIGQRAQLAGGRPLRRYPVSDFAGLARALAGERPPVVLDVR
ncbi:MAG: MBL fold metallo-hydrolase, partial [Actinomycetota bacterium]